MNNKILLSEVTTYRFGGECNSFYIVNSEIGRAHV